MHLGRARPHPSVPRTRTQASAAQAAASSQPTAGPDSAGAGDGSRPPRAVVIGAGFAGYGAANALLQAGVDVVVLDSAETLGGLSAAWRTPQGRAVEPGIKG